MPSMDLDRPFGRAKLGCDLTVGEAAAHHQPQHLSLAAGQARQPRLDGPALGLRQRPLAAESEGVSNTREQHFMVEGFL